MNIWLTRITLNPRAHAVRTDLANAVGLHQRMMALMPDDLGDQARQRAGLLYRIEENHTGQHLLIQSQFEPDTSKLPAQYGTTATRRLDPLLERLDTNLTIHYRIAANTSKRAGRTSPHPGRIVALRGAAADQWWTQRAERCGLRLHTLTSTSMADIRGKHKNTGPADRIHHTITRFDGSATVTDPTALRQAIRDGIGRGKSYGCGLLSVAVTQ